MPESPSPSVIVAVTGEHGRYDAVRSRAAALAAGGRGTVILYDLDAASVLESPLPTNWSAEGTEEEVPTRLSAEDLDRAGRASVADQVRGLRSLGVDAWGWLPPKPGAEALAAYARDRGAEVILVPADLEAPGLLDRIQGNDATRAREVADARVVVVGDEGAEGDVAPEGDVAQDGERLA